MQALQKSNKAVQSWKKILMCRPTSFDVVHKGHNAYMTMEEPVDKSLAMEQWKGVKAAFQSIGTQVEVLEPLAGQVDQVFCANCALVWNGTAVISNMANEPRRAESEPSMKWFKHHGYEVYDSRPTGIKLEGCGDFAYNFDRTHAYLAHGFRTDKAAYDLVNDVVDFGCTRFHSLRLVNELCYHLDTAMLNLSKGHVLLYAPAFDTESLNLIKEVNGEENVIELSKEDCVEHMVPNGIPIQDGDDHYIVCMGMSEELQNNLSNLGYKILKTPYQEFRKSGGSIRCSVLDIGI